MKSKAALCQHRLKDIYTKFKLTFPRQQYEAVSNIRPVLTFSSVLGFTFPRRIIKSYLMTGLGATAYAHTEVVVDYSNR